MTEARPRSGARCRIVRSPVPAGFLLAGWHSWTGVIVAALILGVGFGAFTSVDFALMTQVLQTDLDRGKDLGVINIANSMQQMLAPAIAAPIVAQAGGYPTLYVGVLVVRPGRSRPDLPNQIRTLRS